MAWLRYLYESEHLKLNKGRQADIKRILEKKTMVSIKEDSSKKMMQERMISKNYINLSKVNNEKKTIAWR